MPEKSSYLFITPGTAHPLLVRRRYRIGLAGRGHRELRGRSYARVRRSQVGADNNIICLADRSRTIRVF